MNTATLVVTPRHEKGRKVRKQGFIPAIIYGHGTKNTPIQFPKSNFQRVINEFGQRAKINLVINDEEKSGIIKAVDRHPVTLEVQHVDIQVVQKDETVNWEIPITFSGRENLESKRLVLQVDLAQIEVNGRVDIIPDSIVVDVKNKDINDTITIGDLKLDSRIKTIKTPDTVLAIVKSNYNTAADTIIEDTTEESAV
ncbi:50S ribosomal protein L25 [Maledivibacter halophilus]|uniref:Large ribosomal subunit protein bL25 n=1 Tax=Maledivibacter halophilus TaxID=36842 RepID=A0A1T5IBD5_9FIRM|nr:50S ribosomal protein L25 [Maledivibacter halophilus]SKC36484.1 large subunit ribosomal protein L25 [Maledivibacter halophilus]